MSKTKPVNKTLTAEEVEGAAAPAPEAANAELDKLLAKAEADAKAAADTRAAAENAQNEALAKVKEADDMIAEAEDKVSEIAKIGATEVAKTIEDAKAQAAKIIADAEKAADENAEGVEGESLKVIVDAEGEAASIMAAATGRAAKIIADAEDNAEARRAEKARVAEIEANAKAAADAAKKREAEKKKRAKAKEKALKKPQKIAKDDMRAAILLAGELGDMPTDISALQAKLVQINGAEFDGDAPIHTVKIYGLTVAGPAGFRNALNNWAAAVRRIAKDAA